MRYLNPYAVVLSIPLCAILAFDAAAADKSDFVGRWDVVRSGTAKGKDVAGYMRFKADGTFTSTLLLLNTNNGRFTVVSDRVIELDYPGVLFGRNKMEFKYQLDGKTLTLESNQASVDLEFEKVD